jgi:hypothetical protein
MGDSKEAEKQIVWEYKHLQEADIISFWFDKGSLGPISLYELGKYLHASNKRGFIGIHPEYKRKQDIEIQTNLSRPDIKIVYSLDELIKLIINSKL